jgi:hypothetical protein
LRAIRGSRRRRGRRAPDPTGRPLCLVRTAASGKPSPVPYFARRGRLSPGDDDWCAEW